MRNASEECRAHQHRGASQKLRQNDEVFVLRVACSSLANFVVTLKKIFETRHLCL
jgi:hypothetical protein